MNGPTLGWQPVTNSAPQGPVLLNIFIKDLGAGMQSILSGCADGTQRRDAVDSVAGREALQRELHTLEHRLFGNSTKFNKGKCQAQAQTGGWMAAEQPWRKGLGCAVSYQLFSDLGKDKCVS